MEYPVSNRMILKCSHSFFLIFIFYKNIKIINPNINYLVGN